MDDAVALVVAAPVVALALWAVAFVGGYSNGQARATVAAELAAQAAARSAAHTVGPEAADTAGRVALGATLSACIRTDTILNHADADRTAAVTVVCEVAGPLSGNRVCIAGYAQDRPAASVHARAPCPAP